MSSNQKATMVKGSLWMSAGNLISRLIGAVYIIPWFMWMGENGDTANALYSMGYNIYALFLLISSVGIPAAIAKQTAYYNARNEYKAARIMFYTALRFMFLVGAVAATIMFFSSGAIARGIGGGDELIPVMRSLSVAVLVFPCMSVIRGFFQGNNQLAPVAISNIFEQIIRVFYALLATFIIMRTLQGDFTTAVVHSTFAAFVGMLASFAVLLWFLRKERKALSIKEHLYGENNIRINPTELLGETIKQAIPFIIVGSGIQLFRLVDQFSFIRIMEWFTEYSVSELLVYYAMFSANPDKLTMVLIAFATSVSAAGLPLITENFTKGRKRALAALVENNIQLFLFIMLPAVFGVMVLAYPLYTVFYVPNELGASLLFWTALQSLLLGYYMFASNMLQGMSGNKKAVIYLGIGFIVKLVLQVPFVAYFQVYGPLLGTTIGFLVSCILITRRIYQISRFDLKLLALRSLLLFGIAGIMLGIVFGVQVVLGMFLSFDERMTAFVTVMISGAVGGVVYGFLVLITRIGEALLGKKVRRLRIKLGI
jgi:O-antigen/teichoic acid export membrane protein